MENCKALLSNEQSACQMEGEKLNPFEPGTLDSFPFNLKSAHLVHKFSCLNCSTPLHITKPRNGRGWKGPLEII